MNKQRGSRLSQRDHAVIQQADALRITTLEILRQSLLKGLTRSGVSKIVNRLCRSRYLQSYTLIHPGRYFVLGDAGATLLGRSGHRVLPLGPQALPTEYAAAVHCALGKSARRRMTKDELRQRFPWLPKRLVETPVGLDLKTDVIEMLRVDLGGPAHHVARKCRKDIRTRTAIPEFAELVRKGGLKLVIITGTQEKADAIRAAVRRHRWPEGLKFHCTIVPELLQLTARKPHA